VTQVKEPAAQRQVEDEFVFRPFAMERDVLPLLRLINEIEAIDQVDEGRSESELRASLTWPEGDPARDRVVVEEPGYPDRLIAAVTTWKASTTDRADVRVTVHPDWRRRGLGGALLARGLARAREKGAVYVSAGHDNRMRAAGAFVAAHGFRSTGTWIQMRCEADVLLAEPVYPAGYTVRSHSEVQSVPVLAAALNRGFIGHFEHRDATETEVAHWLGTDHTRADGIFLAFGPAGEPAGICWAEINPDHSARRGRPTGYIDSLAVVPEHRRHGLGRALLLEGIRWLRANGQATIELDAWGENERALPLYEGVGFRISRQGQSYERSL
jgi:mycothiol synthase